MWESEFITPFIHKQLGYLPLAGPSWTAQRAQWRLVELALAERSGEHDPPFAAQ